MFAIASLTLKCGNVAATPTAGAVAFFGRPVPYSKKVVVPKRRVVTLYVLRICTHCSLALKAFPQVQCCHWRFQSGPTFRSRATHAPRLCKDTLSRVRGVARSE